MTYRSVFRPGLFEGQTIIVTGGGSGFGRCIAHELSALGAHVALIGRNAEKLASTEAEITEDGGSAESHVCDIREEETVAKTVTAILANRGRIHGLVNNAGGQFPAPLAQISQKGFETVVRTNLTGGFLMAREVFNQSMQEHGGSIVNITADMWMGMPGMGHSGAARAGMVNFTMTAAVEWAAAGVRVNAVAPGWVISSGFDAYDPEYTKIFRELRHAVPLKRLGTEAEVSAAVCFLLSDAASFISGDCVRVDGAAPLATVTWPMPEHERSQPYEGFHRAKLPDALK
jgi:citronellol/citronellal dehydrogenase